MELEMTPTMKARMAVLDHLLKEMGTDLKVTTINIKVDVVITSRNGDDWTASVTTNAHTDRNYQVTYRSNPGQTLVETFTRSSEVRIWDRQANQFCGPDEEYNGMDYQ